MNLEKNSQRNQSIAVAAVSCASIANLDLSPIENRLLKIGWSDERVSGAVLGYRRFLQTIKDTEDPTELTPEKDVDEVWHEHVLRTKKYAADCNTIFGTFLHHRPDEFQDPRICGPALEPIAQ